MAFIANFRQLSLNRGEHAGLTVLFSFIIGAVTVFARENKEVAVNKCSGHRLELAPKDTMKRVPAFKKNYDRLMTGLVGIFYFYKKSSKQRKQLRRSYAALGMKSRMPTRVNGTRWVSHTLRAIDTVMYGYEAIMTHLASASHDNAKAEGLYNILASTETVAFMLLLKVKIITNKF